MLSVERPFALRTGLSKSKHPYLHHCPSRPAVRQSRRWKRIVIFFPPPLQENQDNTLGDLVVHRLEMSASAPTPPEGADLAKIELNLYIDLYKAHYDLFLKGVAVYLAIVGAIATILFQPGSPLVLRFVLCGFIFACSILALAGSQISLNCIAGTQGQLERICGVLVRFARCSLTRRLQFGQISLVFVKVEGTGNFSILISCRWRTTKTL
jgi:hypothetical protein